MACVELPKIDLPKLPSPLSIAPPQLPSLSADATICCKLVSFSIAPKVPLPPIAINPAVVAAVNTAMDAVEAYLSAIPISCPRE